MKVAAGRGAGRLKEEAIIVLVIVAVIGSSASSSPPLVFDFFGKGSRLGSTRERARLRRNGHEEEEKTQVRRAKKKEKERRRRRRRLARARRPPDGAEKERKLNGSIAREAPLIISSTTARARPPLFSSPSPILHRDFITYTTRFLPSPLQEAKEKKHPSRNPIPSRKSRAPPASPDPGTRRAAPKPPL